MAPAEHRVAVTGAGGYVGGILVDEFRRRGRSVVALVRDPARFPAGARRFDLREPVDAGALEGVDVLVHAAWDLHARHATDVWRTNVDGTTRLFAAARAAGVRRVAFVSSMSAFVGTAQLYGLSKLAAEDAVLGAGGLVLRLGLVYGPGGGGMAGALAKLTGLPLTPVVCPRARQFTVHQDDMARAVVDLSLSGRPPGVPVGVAHPEAVPFRDVLRGIAAMAGRRPRLVRVPGWAVYGALRSAELAGLDLGFRSDSLLGLMKPASSVPGPEVMARLGIALRPFPWPAPASELSAEPGDQPSRRAEVTNDG